MFCDIMGIPGHPVIGATILLLGGGSVAGLIAYGTGNLIGAGVLGAVVLIVSLSALLGCR